MGKTKSGGERAPGKGGKRAGFLLRKERVKRQRAMAENPASTAETNHNNSRKKNERGVKKRESLHTDPERKVTV